MFFKSIILSLIFFGATTGEVMAQTVSGTVRDAQTHDALLGATVIQSGTASGVSTASGGTFSFSLADDAPAEIEVRFLGYKPQAIEVNRDRDTELTVSLIPETFMSENVLVEASRVDERNPVTYSNISRDEIVDHNLGQDIPYLIEMSPSVVSTSDAGAGIGYTSVRIRGVDQARINVTMDGIPVNDSESHGVFWVNMPNLAANLDNIQIQRGVGTSANGPAAFGASMHLQTQTLRQNPYGVVNSSAGSFNTFNNNVSLGTGLLTNGWAFDGSYSKITSDGYIDRASSDLNSFSLSGTRHGDRSLLKLNVISGNEQTYQAWDGVPEDMLETNRTYNPYTYENETDNYGQDHYQAHYSYQLTSDWNINTALHYTRGKGYYEQFREGDQLSDDEYGFNVPDVDEDEEDLIRRRWLDNHFYGMTFSSDYQASERLDFTVGGGYNHYDGDHYGEIIWARMAANTGIRERYYDNNGFKKDFNIYAKGTYNLTDRLSFMGDIQLRTINYDLNGIGSAQEVLDQGHQYTFWNPKAGLVYLLDDDQRVYTSYSIGNKEPTRSDFTDADPGTYASHETLYNLELGYRGDFDGFRFGANYYYMGYDDQLILIGEINDVGGPVRTNVPDSYRMGIELEGATRIASFLSWNGNVTLSRNKVEEFTEGVINYDTPFPYELEETVFHDTDIAFSPALTGASRLSFNHANFRADLQSQYVSRQYLDNTQDVDRSINPYFINNITLHYDLDVIPTGGGIRVSLKANNVLNTMYESNGYTYGFIEGGDEYRQNVYYPQAGRHFLGQVSFRF
ncbi:MAG: TonB-dependent receptor [Balneolales bacterium]